MNIIWYKRLKDLSNKSESMIARICWENLGGKNLLYQIQKILVIYKLNIAPINLFVAVLFLLHLKYMLKHKQLKQSEEKQVFKKVITKITTSK